MEANIKTAIFPGSFYPFTIGHLDILKQALKIFDKVIVVWSKNTEKQYPEFVEKFVKEQQEKLKKRFGCSIEVIESTKLIADICRDKQVSWIIRGLRDSNDFFYEKNMANVNRQLNYMTNTLFLLPSDPKLEYISSTFVKELMIRNVDYSEYVI